MIESKPYTLHFLKKVAVAKDTYSFYFSRPEEFEFTAGQYNRWTLPITATDGRGSSRFFTISSSPLEKDYLTITTKIIQSDFKKALLELKENDEIKIFGPMGEFTLDESDTRERIFIAGGIGITPFHSMLLYAGSNNLSLPLTLLASYSVPEEMVFYDELTQLAKAHSNIRIVYTITKPQESQIPWNGETGRVTEGMLKKYAKDVMQSVFYIVGPPPMVEGTKALLEQMKIPVANVRTEQFTGY
jgi:ferredoxin-NADP reductase